MLLVGDAERVADRQSALLHRGAGQRGKSDHVAGGIDVRHFGLVVAVDFQPFAVVGFQSGCLQIQRVGGSLAADGVEQRLGPEHLARLERRLHQRRRYRCMRGASRSSSTFSPRRSVMPARRIWYWNASAIS